MLDSTLDRILVFRSSTVSDCWGERRAVRYGTRNGLWFIDASALDVRAPAEEAIDTAPKRDVLLQRLLDSGRFTPREIATLQALTVEKLSLAEIAERDGCSRQAVLARLIGNSRSQGGILKKARAILATSSLDPDET